MSSYGQCKYASKSFVKRQSKLLSINIQAWPQVRFIFDDPYINRTQFIANFFNDENNNFYFTFYYNRDNTYPFVILEDQKLVINFENDLKVTLSSYRNFEWKPNPLAIQPCINHIRAFYKIDKEQVEIFARNPLLNFQIYFTSEKNISNTFEDEDGKFFKLAMKTDKTQTSLIEPASCILQSISK
jgi:hypothetical protein